MIQLSAREEAALQQWLERRLVTISDAEAPILAEYCLALLKHDQDAPKVRMLCIEQLRDFLKDSTEVFVDEIFAALESRSYMLGARQQHIVQQADEIEEGEYGPEDEPMPALQETEMRHNSQQNPGVMPFTDQQMMAAFFAAMMAIPPPPPVRICHAYARYHNCPRGDACQFQHIDQPDSYQEHDLPDAVVIERKRTLTVQRIPNECLDKDKIQKYFMQFGQVRRVRLDKPRKSADVVFGTVKAASAAYKSSTPIFGNRFVRTFWRIPPSADERNNEPVHHAHDHSIDSAANAEIAARQEQHQARQGRKQDMARKLQELEEQKRLLLQRQAEQHEAIVKLEQMNGTPDTRTALQIQLDELKQKALALGIDTDLPLANTKQNLQAHKPKAPFKAYARPMKLDNRPKSVLIQGLRTSEEEAILRDSLAASPAFETLLTVGDALVAHFQSRSTAERFVTSKLERLEHVKLSWYSSANKPLQPVDTHTGTQVMQIG